MRGGTLHDLNTAGGVLTREHQVVSAEGRMHQFCARVQRARVQVCSVHVLDLWYFALCCVSPFFEPLDLPQMSQLYATPSM
jgi:hypothetical protein